MDYEDSMNPEPKSRDQVAPNIDATYDKNEHVNEDIYDEETTALAQSMGMSVQEMLDLFDEWNNCDASILYNDPSHDCPPEWPDFTGCEGGYEDEGVAESSHGFISGFDYNATPLHMPPRIVIPKSITE